jgi:4-diphosphocytidyl-2-C-methyl-D-erythritol kinase
LSNFSLFSPAKINLYLAITGRRADGYHDLVSVVAPLNWGDTLHVTTASDTVLTCDDPTLAIDETNLILKATAAFRADTGWKDGVHFRLDKRIPVGAGLGIPWIMMDCVISRRDLVRTACCFWKIHQ